MSQVLHRRMIETTRLPWRELDEYGERTEWHTTQSGERWRFVIRAWWDDRPWESDMVVTFAVYASSGWRRWRPYRVETGRPGPPDQGVAELSRSSAR